MTQRSPLSFLVAFRTDAELLSFNIHIKEQDLHTFLIRFIQHAALDNMKIWILFLLIKKLTYTMVVKDKHPIPYPALHKGSQGALQDVYPLNYL